MSSMASCLIHALIHPSFIYSALPIINTPIIYTHSPSRLIHTLLYPSFTHSPLPIIYTPIIYSHSPSCLIHTLLYPSFTHSPLPIIHTPAVLQGLPERTDARPGHGHQRLPQVCSLTHHHDGAAGSQVWVVTRIVCNVVSFMASIICGTHHL